MMTPARLHLPVLTPPPAFARGAGVPAPRWPVEPGVVPSAAPDLTPDAERSPAPLRDASARRVSYLRVSLLDHCSYRCTYCMPAEGVAVTPREAMLSVAEIAAVVAALQRAGLRRVRLTGGEPTLHPELLPLVSRLAGLGLDDLSLTTNGDRLVELAAPLRAAGLRRINVSVDTLDPERFHRVTRRGRLERVLAGLDAAAAAGLRDTKINTVVMRGFNDDELAALCRFAWERGLVPRFIELMPMGEGALFYPGTFLPAAAVCAALEAAFGPALARDEAPVACAAPPGSGPARYRYFCYQGRVHAAGLISAVTEPFCDSCNRVRLSSSGQIQVCLGHDAAVELRPLLRSGLSGDALSAAVLAAVGAALQQKPAGHEFQRDGCGGPRKHMVSCGG